MSCLVTSLFPRQETVTTYAYPSGWGAIESCCWKWKRSLIIWMAPLHDQPSDNVYTRTVEPLGRLPLLSCHQTNSFLCQQFEPCIYSLCRVTAWQKKKKIENIYCANLLVLHPSLLLYLCLGQSDSKKRCITGFSFCCVWLKYQHLKIIND